MSMITTDKPKGNPDSVKSGFGWYHDADGQLITFFTDCGDIEQRWIEDSCNNDYNQYILQLEADQLMRLNLRHLDRIESPNVRKEFHEPFIENLGLRVNRIGNGGRRIRRRT